MIYKKNISRLQKGGETKKKTNAEIMAEARKNQAIEKEAQKKDAEKGAMLNPVTVKIKKDEPKVGYKKEKTTLTSKDYIGDKEAKDKIATEPTKVAQEALKTESKPTQTTQTTQTKPKVKAKVKAKTTAGTTVVPETPGSNTTKSKTSGIAGTSGINVDAGILDSTVFDPSSMLMHNPKATDSIYMDHVNREFPKFGDISKISNNFSMPPAVSANHFAIPSNRTQYIQGNDTLPIVNNRAELGKVQST